jgi:hypothetical protein
MKKISLVVSLLSLTLLASCVAGSPATTTSEAAPTSSVAPVKKIVDFVKAYATGKLADNKTGQTSAYYITSDTIEYTTTNGAKVSTFYTLLLSVDSQALTVNGDSIINSQNSYSAAIRFQEGGYNSSSVSSYSDFAISNKSYYFDLSNLTFRSDDCVSHFSYQVNTQIFSAPTADDATQKIWLENAMYACNNGIQYFDKLLVSAGYKTFGGSTTYSAQDVTWETL